MGRAWFSGSVPRQARLDTPSAALAVSGGRCGVGTLPTGGCRSYRAMMHPVGNNGPSDEFGYLGRYGITEGMGSVHLEGNPIIGR